ncbi:hypothetical protein [Roseisolibacter sp. H3M3-2]|uniref:hypothetical protein n=1 Tax=Roseisolibacter sp. H3M3-2 TaxID=3031323 RepID=UPI0023DA8518|nr:hypothetical protein [Roseisolibacter sp. H3M3-2]MDF1505184.1 hypothetical protein [Roseisolibacter sp. H3M3-2]
MTAPPPTPTPRERGLSADERRDVREAALTFLPAVLLAVALGEALVAHAGWTPRRALLAGVGTGLTLAVLVLRTLRRPRPH